MTSIKEAIAHVQKAFDLAIVCQSKLTPEVLAIKGFSTPTMRHFFNNLCGDPIEEYLEVGAFFGASACAAACGNSKLNAVVIEDFSQDFSEKGVRDALYQNLTDLNGESGIVEVVESDCFQFDAGRLAAYPTEVFFFDGNHGYESQAKALPHFAPALADICIAVVDDFNWPDVERGTRDGIDAIRGKFRLEKEWVIATQQDDPVWHNGIFVGVFSKVEQPFGRELYASGEFLKAQLPPK